MYTKQPKKTIILNILDILKKYSDSEHRFSQADIIKKLKSEYNVDVNRKTILPNILGLIESGYDIEYSEVIRKKDETMATDFYLNRDFTDEELRVIIDSLLFSKYIPDKQCKELIEKLEKLSSVYFKYKVKYIQNLPEKTLRNNELFYNISVIDEAIGKGCQISFIYKDFGTNKKLKARKSKDGNIKKYTVSPYQMVATNGRYYLMCNHGCYDNIAYYRIDRIGSVKLEEDTHARPVRELKGCENGLNLPQIMAEHVYMFSGESQMVSFRANKKIVTDIIDWFGTEVIFTDETEDEVTATVFVNLAAMRYWVLQYSRYVKVLRPHSLVENVKDDLKSALKKYE